MSVAALPMYDWPELAPATDAFWRAVSEALCERGLSAPASLSRDRPPIEVWRDPELALAQSCGADFVSHLKERVVPIAAPVYAAPGCAAHLYSSWIVTRRGEEPDRPESLRARVAAVNGFGSFSGWWALRGADLAPEKTRITGAHRLSAASVAAGEADFAAIDAVAYAHLERFDPDVAARLAKVAQTTLRPAPPFVTARARADQAALIRAALGEAIARAPEAAAELLLEDVAPISAADYRDFETLAPHSAGPPLGD